MHFEESPLLQRPGNAGMELRKKEYDCATYHSSAQGTVKRDISRKAGLSDPT